MSYLTRLKTIFSNYYVTEELGYDFQESDGTALVIKYLGGISLSGYKMQPIQLYVYTKDVPMTLTELNQFVTTYSNNSYWQGLDYYREQYYTPVVISNHDPANTNYYSIILITGTLIMSENVSDIDKIYIDNELVETSGRAQLIYAANLDSQRVQGQNINKTDVINGMVRLFIPLTPKANNLNTKIRNIRTGAISVNTKFTIKLVFTDNEMEEIYTMVLDNSGLAFDKSSLPEHTLQFTV